MTVAPTTDSASDIPADVDDLADRRSIGLTYRPPFAGDMLLSFLGARALRGVEEVEDGTYRRCVRLLDGSAAVIGLKPDIMARHVTLHGPEDDALVQSARRAFDLDADPLAIDTKLAEDPKLAPLVAKSPGMRVPGTFDGFELVVRAIFGQQVSVAGARTSLGRLVERFGTPLDPPSGGITHLFPTAEPGGRAATRSVRDAPRPGGDDPARGPSRRSRRTRSLRVTPNRRRRSDTRRAPRDRSVDPRLRRDARAPGRGRIHGRRPRRAEGLEALDSPRHRRSSSRDRSVGDRGVRTP